MSTKPWGNIGAWAADVEAEELEAAAAAAAAADSSSQSFPSLKEAATAKPKKKKMTLSEFNMASSYSASSGGRGSTQYNQGLTPEEMRQLPTGPKQRSAEEMQYGRLGGGFSSYGRSSLPGRGRDRDDGDGSWGGGSRRPYGGFDQERRGPPPSRVSDLDQPSRADEVDNWALTKKPLPPSLDSGRNNRYGSLGGGSRADDIDNWAVGKKPLPAKSSTFGSGFRDSGPEPERWTRGGGAFRESDRERHRLVLDPPRGDSGVDESPVVVVNSNKPNPFGAARPREQVLAEKGLDWKKMESDIEAKKASTPTSAHSSRPSSAQSNRSEGQGLQPVFENVGKPRPKVNPFGDAKPREVLLEERGKNWRKIDLELEHRSVDRPETEEEKRLKEELYHLKQELQREFTAEANRESLEESSGDQSSLCDIIHLKETELEALIHDLDVKVRFGQKAVERPGSRPSSGAGRAAGFPERPPSQSGPNEETRNPEFMDRPRSRGTLDVWTRSADGRRSFGSGRDRAFHGNRDLDRPRPREGW